MQHATTTDTAAKANASNSGADAAVRVVTPVGGRDGWRAVDTDADPETSTCSGLENAADDDGMRAWLGDYLSGTLDRDDRILLILFYFEVLNPREIGAVIGATEASVDARLTALNRALRVAYRDFLEQPPEDD